MARQPHPLQASLLAELDASLVGPIVRPSADAVWAVRLLELVAEGLPPGARSPFTEVLSATPDRAGFGETARMSGDVRMFYGVLHTLGITWSLGHRVYWLRYPVMAQDAPLMCGRAATPAIRWDARAEAWVRMPPSPTHAPAIGW